jgi:tRNA-dihydrouridine synthase A
MPLASRGACPRLSIAPMLDHSDRHFRWLVRQLTRRALIYSEMVVMHAVLHGDRRKLLGFDPEERPLALQLGGDDPEALAACARVAWELGWDEVNLNVGCPSDRVRAGCFGAVLMARPERVADCVAAMRAAVPLPVTVKHRIGIDDADSYEHLLHFVDTVAAAGCDRFTVHARKAVLGGLSPRENREIPPLRHADVHRLKVDRPALVIELNGGVRTPEQAVPHLEHVDAVMIGRGAIEATWGLASADRVVFGAPDPLTSRRELVERAEQRLRAELAADPAFRPRWLLRHLLPLYAGQPGAARWRRTLAERMDEGVDGLRAALAAVTAQSC